MIALGLAGIALPILGALVGHDYLIPRSVIGSLAPLLLATAIGFDRLRWGLPAAAAVCVVWIAITVATAGDPKFRREDWRAATAAVRGADAVLVVPRSGVRPLRYYRPGARQVDSARVSSVAVLRMGQSSGFGCRSPTRRRCPRGCDRDVRQVLEGRRAPLARPARDRGRRRLAACASPGATPYPLAACVSPPPR